MILWIIGAVVLFFLISIRIVQEYEHGVKFTFGRYAGIMGPGLRLVFPVIQTWQKIDRRTKVVDVPSQDAITKDNVSIKVDAVLYFRVVESEKAILQVENYRYAVSQLAQTTMRDAVGETSLDDLLSKRDQVSSKIKVIVDKATDPWGIKVESVELKHVELPEDLKRVIGREAEAEREKRATIINAEGEFIASQNMAKAANVLAKAPGALHLRTLQSINDMSSDKSNTVVFAIPVEILKAMEGLKGK